MSVLTDTRQAYLRHTTKTFIEGDPTVIALKRQTKVAKPGGGHDFPKTPLDPQTFRFINQGLSGGLSYAADDGIARRFDYILVGFHDADLAVNDTWADGEQQYKVTSMVPNNGWEARAHVIGYAMEPEHG